MISGEEAEDIFVRTFKKKGCEIRPSSRWQNMFDHFDFIVDDQKVEVKSEKAMNRGEESSPIFWIEAINVKGNIGWLYGKSDWIAFLHEGEFWLIKTKILQRYIEKNTTNYKNPGTKKGYKKWYRRYGRMDSVTYVYPEDIEFIVSNKIKIVVN